MLNHQQLLFDAIERGHTSIVLKLLRNHANMNITDIQGRTPLMIAAKYGRNDIVKILLEHTNSETIQADKGGKTPLHYAAESSEISVVKTLCKHQASWMTMATTQTQLYPLDYVLDDDDLYPVLNRYTQSGQVSPGESDNDDDNVPKAELYKKKKKKGSGKKKKSGGGGGKSGSKKKKKGGKKKR